MKRPTKKAEKGYCTFDPRWREDKGYNKACDDWEEFLPNILELENIICEGLQDKGGRDYVFDIARDIDKRLRGK